MRLTSGRLLATNTGSGAVASTGGRGRRAAEVEEEGLLDGDLGVLPMDVFDDRGRRSWQLRLLVSSAEDVDGGAIPSPRSARS